MGDGVGEWEFDSRQNDSRRMKNLRVGDGQCTQAKA